MTRIEKLPPVFKRYWKMGGVLNFAMFNDADGSEDEIVRAVSEVLSPKGRNASDIEKLRSLGARIVNERSFFGDWYDRSTGRLLRIGHYYSDDGQEFENPSFHQLEGVNIRSGSGPVPEAGTGGNFAYAFSQPPYSLRGRPLEVQAVFDMIKDLILPPLKWVEIRDWSNPRLAEVSGYFKPGMEWWGVFLFSIHAPSERQLTIIAGSTSD